MVDEDLPVGLAVAHVVCVESLGVSSLKMFVRVWKRTKIPFSRGTYMDVARRMKISRRTGKSNEIPQMRSCNIYRTSVRPAATSRVVDDHISTYI